MSERLYTASATAEGARTGRVASDDGRLEHSLSRPASMGGDDGPGTNPEQLFAAGYAACFHSATRHVLRPLGLRPEHMEGSSVTAHVHFDRSAPTEFDLAVDLVGRFPAMSPEQAQQVMEATHQVCPYSRATRGNVAVTLGVDGAAGGE